MHYGIPNVYIWMCLQNSLTSNAALVATMNLSYVMEAISGEVSVDTVAVRNYHMQCADEFTDE